MKVIELKQWSEYHLSYLAWPRIVDTIFPQMSEEKWSLEDLEEPDLNFTFDQHQLKLFHDAVFEMYGVNYIKSVM